MLLPAEVFRNYDIRGLADTQITPEVSERIGKAFGTFALSNFGKKIVIGSDNRSSSEKIKESFIEGAVSVGCDVVDIGLSLTPIIQFLTFDTRFDCGVMVTASHDPIDYNGFRLIGKEAFPIYGDDLQRILKLCEENIFQSATGCVVTSNLTHYYTDYILKNFSFKKKHNVVVSCGYGTSSIIVSDLFTKAKVNLTTTDCKLDSAFPKGIPDPENSKFMEFLRQEVVKNKADVGFAFDPDSDRFGVVDEKGNYYHNDKLLVLFAKYLLKRYPSAYVVYDVKCSMLVEKYILEFGGKPVMIRTGHPYFINAVKNGKAMFGAEYSGHSYFGDSYFGFDDGIYAAFRVLQILDSENKTLSKLMSEFAGTYSISEVKVACEEGDKTNIISEIRKTLEANIKFKRIVEVDGLRVYMDDESWFLIRQSNTTPHIVFRAEAYKKERLEEVLTYVRDTLPMFKDIKVDIYFS